MDLPGARDQENADKNQESRHHPLPHMAFFEVENANTGARDPEKIWMATHELIVAVTDDLPIGQCMRIKGEALLSDLESYLPQICEWLEIRTDKEAINSMMHPEDSPYASEGPPGAPRGNDPNFLTHPAIDSARLAKLSEPTLDGELDWRPGELFTPETRKLAKQLGYQ